ncbi:MAG: hypothetical protein K0S80_4431 [Neobacillus sp.]|nr:hypothetical protein [Neobacillus sp.]
MGTENQKKYCLSKVRNVEWDSKRKCLNVHYDDTWWKYDDNGWY